MSRQLYIIEVFLPPNKPGDKQGCVSRLTVGYVVKTREGRYTVARTRDKTIAHQMTLVETGVAMDLALQSWAPNNDDVAPAFEVQPVKNDAPK